MKRAALVALLLLLGCGKREAPTAKVDAARPKPEPPPATPAGVIGCRDITLGIPNATKTQYVILDVDTKRMGAVVKNHDISNHALGIVVTLEVYEKPVTGEILCTDMGNEPQAGERYVGVAGRVTYEVEDGKYASARIENARFVDAKGRIVEVPISVATNVRVGWVPG